VLAVAEERLRARTSYKIIFERKTCVTACVCVCVCVCGEIHMNKSMASFKNLDCLHCRGFKSI